MSGWQRKRFWTRTEVEPQGDGFAIMLDGRRVSTPTKAPLLLPTRSLADAVAVEWDAQHGKIDPRQMPMTCSANAALDKIIPQFDEVVALITDYGGSDLLCYRASYPKELVRRQSEAWDPMIDWAARAHGIHLAVTAGIAPIYQSAEDLKKLADMVGAFSPFGLTALYDLVGMSGSLVLGLAAAAGIAPPETIWSLSRIDEDWQAEQWGHDDAATIAAEHKKKEFLHAHRFLTLGKA